LVEGSCIDNREVPCDEDNDNPAHSTDTIVNVTITYTTIGGWTLPADCAWTCDDGYQQDEHGFCNLIGGPCEDNPCTEEHKHVCTDDGGNPVCSCDPHYSDDGQGDCVADTQIIACVNILPENAGWLLIDEYDGAGNLEQTWNGTGWAPLADTCPWDCDDGFFLNGEATACIECLIDGDCDDDSVCTGTETCELGSCIPGTSLVCADDNACTDDQCDPSAGCLYMDDDTNTCDDGNDLTENDACFEGDCTGDPVPGICGNAIPVGALPYTTTGDLTGRPSGLTTYGTLCTGESEPTSDIVYELTVEAGVEYRIAAMLGDSDLVALNLLGVCGENEECLAWASAPGGEVEMTYAPEAGGIVYIAIEGTGAYELSISIVEQPDDDTVEPDDILPDDIATDDILPDETLVDEEVVDEEGPDEVVIDDVTTDDVPIDEEESDVDIVTDEEVTDDTVTDADAVKPDIAPDKDSAVTDTPVTDTTVVDNEIPDETGDELLGDEDTVIPGTDTGKPTDNGCGCSLAF